MDKFKSKSAATVALENEIQRLKSEAYDCIAAVTHYQSQLREVEQKIVELSQKRSSDEKNPTE